MRDGILYPRLRHVSHAHPTVLELVEAFYQQGLRTASGKRKTEGAPADPPPTRLRLRREVLAGTWEALLSGQAD
ncbi:MAG: hypothetical protein ACKOER_04145, partial [Betaproteobacteria bacterium]